MTGIIVFAHGSSVESANEAVRDVVRSMIEAGGFPLVETAFLDGGEPRLEGAVERLLARGVAKIVVVPYFLTLGLHLKRDLPELIERVRHAHPQLTDVVVTDPLDGHPALAGILVERAQAALR
ncbi:MAG: CbiX/SirB N-terminal domain-containing protein [Bryobacteraceae bacterium]|nr:CbiX/SirB N-terminal domain-containing protein [Bryobacteraceae bacterium]